ncbi:MAG: hypothetical protein DRP59_12285 [Spirochaetes bacterium]|nr:MAG: hypothetical protein DRP59_12285 [Spirochaetota bacterium]
MKKTSVITFLAILVLVIAGCASAPTSAPAAPEAKVSATIDFGPYWTGTVRMEKESNTGLKDNAEAVFYSEWTMGESAGNVYPKSFTSTVTGSEEQMDFLWDKGGDIKAGIYDVVVDVDGMPGTGTIKNLELKKGTEYNIYLSFNAAKVAIDFQTDGDDLYVYPAGTYSKYEDLGRLDNIPEELLINHINSYNENNAIWWLIPAGVPLDIYRTHSNGDAEWFKDYTAKPESFIKNFE